MNDSAGHGAGDLERKAALDHLGGRPADLDEQPARHRVALHHHVAPVSRCGIQATAGRVIDPADEIATRIGLESAAHER